VKPVGEIDEIPLFAQSHGAIGFTTAATGEGMEISL